jgi:hypothetical protein
LPVNLATEDELSEAVATKIVCSCFGDNSLGLKLRKNGNGYLRSRMPNFRQMAQREPILVITDLDRIHCAPQLIEQWIGLDPLPDRLLLRVAVREIESWLLADREGFANFLGISPAVMPQNPEILPDPKNFLLNIAKRARRNVRSELIVSRGSVAGQGLGYNRTLSQFVRDHWDIDAARQCSDSLRRAVDRLSELALASII